MVSVGRKKSFFQTKLDSGLSRIIKKSNQKIPVLGENQETSCLKMFVIEFCQKFE